MKKIITILFLSISLTIFGQDTYNFKVEITDFRNSEGNVLIQIFDAKENVIQTHVSLIEKNKTTFEVTGLPKGKYAIRYFHDEDMDNKLGMKWDMIPNEGFGYSNNAKGMFGEPEFKDWLFLLTENKVLNLKCSYLF